VRDQVLTCTPSYFDNDEVEECSDDDSDENQPTKGQIVLAKDLLHDNLMQ
jgi:hypothetical protein